MIVKLIRWALTGALLLTCFIETGHVFPTIALALIFLALERVAARWKREEVLSLGDLRVHR